MARNRRTKVRKTLKPARWRGADQVLPTWQSSPGAVGNHRCIDLLQALAQRGHAEDDLLPIAEFEKAMSAFAAEVAKRIPVQFHADLHQAVENFARRMFADS